MSLENPSILLGLICGKYLASASLFSPLSFFFNFKHSLPQDSIHTSIFLAVLLILPLYTNQYAEIFTLTFLI